MNWWAWLLIAIAAVVVVFGAVFGRSIGSDLFRYRRMHRM